MKTQEVKHISALWLAAPGATQSHRDPSFFCPASRTGLKSSGVAPAL